MHEQPRQSPARGVPRPSRLRSALSRLLCLLVLPVALTVTTTGAAQAAVAVSDGVEAAWRFDDFVPGQWADCTTTVYYRVDEPTTGPIAQQVKSANGDCETGTGWDLEVAEFWASGVTGTGAACSFPRTAGSIGADDAFAFTLTLGASSIEGMCQVTEICMFGADESPWGDEDFTDCSAVGMGVPPDPGPSMDGTCAWGNVLAVSPEVEYGNNRWRLNIVWGGTPDPSAIFMFRGYLAGRTDVGSPGDQRWNYDHAVQVAGGTTQTAWQAWNIGPTYSFGAFEIIPWTFTPSPDTPPGAQAIIQGPSYLGPLDTPANGGPGSKGYTNPDMCAWWYGPKAYNDPASIFDEPAGSLDGEPTGGEPDPPPPVNQPPVGKPDCDFSITDPTTWLEGGMCAAVGLLGGILNTLGQVVAGIAGLAASIAGALVGMLEDLFLPNPDSWGLDEVWDQVQTKPPMSLAAGLLTGINAAVDSFSGNGCTQGLYGLEVGDETVQVLPCDGPAVSNWSTAYAIASVGMWITTGWIVWNMVLGATRKGD